MSRRVSKAKEDEHIIIRRYKPGDNMPCRVLWTDLTAWHRHIYGDPSIGGKNPGRYFDRHLKKVGRKYVWVAVVEGRIVGLAGMILGEHEAELEPLVVSERYRGRGIGRSLVETVIRAARREGAHSLTVSPVARNVRAVRFFHELGFDTLGHIGMFNDFTPTSRQKWKSGMRIADRDFRF